MIQVFISSKLDEMDTERAIMSELVRRIGLKPILAEEWGPDRRSAKDVYLDYVVQCPIYIAAFYLKYSEPTREEYEAARLHPYRTILIYLRAIKEEARDKKLDKFINILQKRHKCFNYNRPEDLMRIFPMHLHKALKDMIDILMNIGKTTKGGQAWGPFPGFEEETAGTVEIFLNSLGFQNGQFDSRTAKDIVLHINKALEDTRMMMADS